MTPTELPRGGRERGYVYTTVVGRHNSTRVDVDKRESRRGQKGEDGLKKKEKENDKKQHSSTIYYILLPLIHTVYNCYNSSIIYYS